MSNSIIERTNQNMITFIIGVAVLLFAVVPAAQARKLYTSNLSVDTVASVEVEGGVAIGPVSHLPVGTRPGTVAINPKGTRIYVASRGVVDGPDPDDVYVINSEDNSVETVQVGDKPNSIVVAPDGKKVYVGNTGTNTLSVIDTTDNGVTTALEGQVTSVGEVAVHPDGSRVYVTDPTGQRILVMSSASNEVEDEIQLPDSELGNPTVPVEVAFTPDGETMIVTYTTDKQPAAWSYGGVWFMGADRNAESYHQIESTLATGDRVYSSHLVVTPDGSRSYVANTRAASDQIYELDNAKQELIGDPIEPGNNALVNGPWYTAMSPDGAFAIAGNVSSIANFVSVVDSDPDSGTYKSVLDPIMILHPNPNTPTLPTRPYGVALTPNQSPVGALSVKAGSVGSATLLDASSSRDADGRISEYHWAFGDGKSATTSSPEIQHVYPSTGVYTAHVTVEDNDGSMGDLVYTGKATLHAAGQAEVSSTFEVAAVSGTGQPQATTPAPGGDSSQGKKSTNLKLRISRPGNSKRYRGKQLKSFKGTAVGGSKIKVRYSLAQRVTKKKRVNGKLKRLKRCRLQTAKGKRKQRKLRSCKKRVYRSTNGSEKWSVRIKKPIKRGSYILIVKATNAEDKRAIKKASFKVVK